MGISLSLFLARALSVAQGFMASPTVKFTAPIAVAGHPHRFKTACAMSIASVLDLPGVLLNLILYQTFLDFTRFSRVAKGAYMNLRNAVSGDRVILKRFATERFNHNVLFQFNLDKIQRRNEWDVFTFHGRHSPSDLISYFDYFSSCRKHCYLVSLGECQYVPKVGDVVQNISAEVEANSDDRAEKVRRLRSQAEFHFEFVCRLNTDRLIFEDSLIVGLSTASEDQRLEHEEGDLIRGSSLILGGSLYELYLLHLTIGYMKPESSAASVAK